MSTIQSNIKGRWFRKKLRERLLKHYGTICVCCGEKEMRFLTFDHIDNDAYKERKEKRYINSGLSFQLYLLKYHPKNIQILCWNCNCGKKENGGVCPHKNIVIPSPAHT